MINIPVGGHSRHFRSAVADLRAICVRCAFSRERCDEVLTAVHEALSNAVEHGSRDRRTGSIRMISRIEQGAVLVDIQDPGVGPVMVNPIPNLDAQIHGRERVAGWGLFLIRCFASEVVFTRGPSGHTLHLRFGASAPPSPVEPILTRLEDGL
jgi:serine/threonine-protein kinase RsbW